MTTVAEPVGMTVKNHPAIAEERKVKPVKLFAWIGVAFTVFEVFVLARWILSGHATRTPTGPDSPPGWMKAVLLGWTIGGLIALGVCIYFWVYKQWKREGRISIDGCFTLGFIPVYFLQDPLLNYFQVWCTYNAWMPNWGSWVNDVPGAIAPKAHMFAEPPLWSAPTYAYLVVALMIIGNKVMSMAKRRWPQMGTVGLIAICFCTFIVIDMLIEPPFMMLGFYAYPGAIKELTLFHGHYFQFPIYEAILFGGVTWGGWAALRFFKNDKGQTLMERGIDQVRATGGQKNWIRFFAVLGAMHSVFLLGYNIPMQLFGMHSDPWPEDILNRSYLTNGVCGPGTEYACSGDGVPVPRPDSAHLSPGGKLIVPAGTQLPTGSE